MIRTRPIRECAPSPENRVGIGWPQEDKPRLGPLRAKRGMFLFKDAEGMRDALAKQTIHGAVRGTLDAAQFVEAFSSKGPFQRGALLEPAANHGVVFGPVGITEGADVAARVRFAAGAAAMLTGCGMASEDPLIAVLSVGRLGDAPRAPRVAESLAESQKVVGDLEKRGLDAFLGEAMLEDVITAADIVVAPDGAAGNLAFRALHLVGGMRSFGALCVGGPAGLVDTSRARKDYEDPVRLAAYLAARRAH